MHAGVHAHVPVCVLSMCVCVCLAKMEVWFAVVVAIVSNAPLQGPVPAQRQHTVQQKGILKFPKQVYVIGSEDVFPAMSLKDPTQFSVRLSHPSTFMDSF